MFTEWKTQLVPMSTRVDTNMGLSSASVFLIVRIPSSRNSTFQNLWSEAHRSTRMVRSSPVKVFVAAIEHIVKLGGVLTVATVLRTMCGVSMVAGCESPGIGINEGGDNEGGGSGGGGASLVWALPVIGSKSRIAATSTTSGIPNATLQ